VTSLDDLAKPGIKLVIGAESVPVGSYTREVLAELPPGQEQAILDNVRSEEPDVKGVVGKIAQGAADAGFVYNTDVTAAGDDLKAITLPAELQPTVAYGAGVIEGAEQPELAQQYLDGLTDGACADALQAAGFGPPPSG
jgi:molybdate transport system substrate-binding protein